MAAAVQAVLVGADGTAPGCDAALGIITLALEGATPDRALGAALDFMGTPGADNIAAGRVTDAALGIIALLGAADAATGRVSGAPLLVAALVAELAVAEVAGAVGAAAGATDDVTVAVIE